MADTAARVTPRLSRSARRLQLMSAAKSAFVTQGYHAAAMDDIADRAGVSKPVLYQHFPSKLELYLALLNESADEMVRLVRVALSATTDNHERVDNAVAAYFTFVADNGQAYRLIFESDLRGQLEVERIVERATDDCISAITDTITADTGVDVERARLLASGHGGSVPGQRPVLVAAVAACVAARGDRAAVHPDVARDFPVPPPGSALTGSSSGILTAGSTDRTGQPEPKPTRRVSAGAMST